MRFDESNFGEGNSELTYRWLRGKNFPRHGVSTWLLALRSELKKLQKLLLKAQCSCPHEEFAHHFTYRRKSEAYTGSIVARMLVETNLR